MSYWDDTKNRLEELNTSCDIAMMAYKKIATSRVNMLAIIKPSFYMGQLSVLACDYMRYVDRFLASEERDWGEYVKFILYIREIAKRLVGSVQNFQGPLAQLIAAIDEIHEGERFDEEDDFDEESEPEKLEEPENLDLVSDEKEDRPEDEDGDYSSEELKICREEVYKEHDALKAELRVKLHQADAPPRIVEELARVISDVYLECIQLSREVDRLSRFPDGDIATLMSILIDIQYGVCIEMMKHLFEDIMVEERFHFNPGLLTWTAHFLASFSDKIDQGWKAEETEG
jgi:hypothetical protein